ncbi:hypothetical protein P5V15_010366 [Pogonomyrmex californicus]
MGMKTKKKTGKKKKRILPTAKRGGVLPILPILGALGSLIGGAASVAKAINDRKVAQRPLEELQRRAKETRGQGLYLAPYKYGRGLYLAPYKGGRGVTAKKRKKEKKRQRDDKNTYGCNHQCTIGPAGEAYARTVL